MTGDVWFLDDKFEDRSSDVTVAFGKPSVSRFDGSDWTHIEILPTIRIGLTAAKRDGPYELAPRGGCWRGANPVSRVLFTRVASPPVKNKKNWTGRQIAAHFNPFP